MARYKITVIPLTNVHIGTGEEIDLLHYSVIDGEFWRFNPDSVISYLDDEVKQELYEYIDK
ncbi:MAG: hypothetical protein KKD38_04265, partial [Candidatus Delongbacteria bacterium]|nr:hypothetical protein [Candidatus Delongbacteria bacterium]MCG2760500.1 hypothetical protein [Candidatus Delongbacteria bacterium]